MKNQSMPTPEEIDIAHAAAQRVVGVHRRLVEWLKHGVTLGQVDQFVAKTLAELGCKSCFLGYNPDRRKPRFPSHACLSVNDCIVHGTAGYLTRPLTSGDLLKVDIGVWYNDWVGDAAWTYSFGKPSETVRRLMDCGKESLRLGVQTLRPENTYMEWARVVQTHVEKRCGFHLLRNYLGHGYRGRQLHRPPNISNVVPDHPQQFPDMLQRCEAGTFVAVEPMIAVGSGEPKDDDRAWPVFTADGSMSVHYEHDVLVTDGEPIVLTHGLEELPDVIER